MRVLLVDVNCKKGSTGKIVYDLYNCLQAQGHTAAICYGRGSVIREPNICKFASDTEVKIHALLTRITGMTSCFSPFATKRLLRFITDFKPDIVHLHDIHGYFVNINTFLRFLKKQNIKTILTLHCEYMYTGKCGYAYKCEKWKTQCGSCPEKKSYPKSMFFDFSKKMFNEKQSIYEDFNKLTVVSVSKWLDNRVKSSILGDKRQFVVYNGIDTEIFKMRDTSTLYTKHGLGDEKIVLHVTGNFEDSRKGGQFVLQLAQRMPDVHFFIIGNNGPIKDLPDNITAIGRTENQTQLAEYYSMANVSVITSNVENFPTVGIESICCGTPVIGFDCGGTAETAPGNFGCFVKFGDMEALEAAVRSALNGELCSKNECAIFGTEKYAKEKMFLSYMDIYCN